MELNPPEDLYDNVSYDGIAPFDSISEADPNELYEEDINDSDNESTDSYQEERMSAISGKSNCSAGGSQWYMFRLLFDKVPLQIRGSPPPEHISIAKRLDTAVSDREPELLCDIQLIKHLSWIAYRPWTIMPRVPQPSEGFSTRCRELPAHSEHSFGPKRSSALVFHG
jgi:hypothetical protein